MSTAPLVRRLEDVEFRFYSAVHTLRWVLYQRRLHRECRQQQQLAFKLGRDCERDSLGLATRNYSGYFTPEVMEGKGPRTFV